MIEKTAKVWLGGRKGVTAPIRLSQYDTGWRFLFSVYNGDMVYAGTDSTTVYMEGKKADDTVFAVPGTFSDGVAVVECTSSITAAVGVIDCELRISEDGETIGTANFDMIVEAAPLRGYVASGDDFSAMQQVLDGAEEAAADALSAKNEAEAEKNAAAASAAAAALSAATAQVQAGMAYKIAATAAAMTDRTIGYVYTGSETGYVNGGWYYWDGSAWTLGGQATDPTLSVAGAPADAKVTGTEIGDLKSALNHYCIDGGDLSGFEKPCLIRDDKWGSSATGKHLSIPIGDATEVFLHSNSLKKCLYAFLTDDTVVVGGTPPFVSGTSVYELAIGASATVAVPDGAKYLYLNYLFSTDNYLPSELKFDGISFYASFRNLIYNNGVVADEAHQITGKMEAIEKVPDYYIDLNTDPVNISEPVISTGIYSYSIINCLPGNIFTINATGENAPRAYAFVDDNNHVVEKAPADSRYRNFMRIAPLGAVKLIINDNSGSTSYKGATLSNRERVFNSNLLYREIYPLTDSSTLSINSSAYSATFVGALGPITATGGFATDLNLTCSWGDEENPDYVRFIMFNKQNRILVAVSRYADETVLADLIANPTNYAILAAYHQRYNAYRFTSSAFPGHWYIDGVDVYSQAIDTIAQTVDTVAQTKALSVKAFRRVGCIGDSYTEGYIDIGDGSVVIDKNYAWPHYMESITGNVWTNFGKSGSSCKSWVDGGAYSNLGLVQAEGNRCQAYVIGLMINDSNPNAHAYVALGTASDIGTEANTYYAYYYRLIQAVHAVNTEAPIFCATCPRTESRFSDYNAAVRTIVTYCQNNNLPVFLLDLAGSKYNTTEYYKHPVFSTDYTKGHYTAIGYELMAECYVRVISDVINENISSFKNIHLIDYDVAT